jgi:hypothetical protein
MLLTPTADNAIWRVLGRTCSDEHWPGESGQVVYDKSGNEGLNLAVLHLSNHMMDNQDMYGFLSYGDKDTYVSFECVKHSRQLTFSSATHSTPSACHTSRLRACSRLSAGTSVRTARRHPTTSAGTR